MAQAVFRLRFFCEKFVCPYRRPGLTGPVSWKRMNLHTEMASAEGDGAKCLSLSQRSGQTQRHGLWGLHCAGIPG